MPKPTGQGVSITNLPEMEVYVLPYGGFSSQSIERSKASELIKKLEASKEPFSTSFWFTAGYDSPYQLANRRNEVWIPRTAAVAQKSGSGGSGGGSGGSSSTASEAGKKSGGN